MAMKQIRGFRIRLKLVKAIKWAIQERQKDSGYCKLKSTNCADKAITKLCKFGRNLKTSVKELWFRKSGSNYNRVGDKTPVPRGHLAVYFGEEEDDAHRVLVPVVYFNHPLFSDLLREAEKVYGFNHRGGIRVPCRISEFENVQTRISAAGGRGGRGGYGL
ncbi:auxin-responsive protein SAUR36 [Cynara cardunculus var. scolymus]|uniref:Auxin responsive SAUR protein n=1 Tax=Cynara cardunculus var. scolymus TaxID=59895 RepID=A0A103XGA7_CYNCS|nr:auxin-responsive protein SAUR36 [Cynara cardunculus var. scolymus]KVH90149.1 Auxin responsive SAUR protein [Cynara cardunculus var. scolymus]